jgi:hypothetical protein
MANTSNAKTVEAIFVRTASNDRSIISSELGRVGNTDSFVAVANARTAVGVLVADGIVTLLGRVGNADSFVAVTHARTAVRVLVADGIAAFDLGRVGNTDALVTVTNAGTAVRILVANRITSVDKAY